MCQQSSLDNSWTAKSDYPRTKGRYAKRQGFYGSNSPLNMKLASGLPGDVVQFQAETEFLSSPPRPYRLWPGEGGNWTFCFLFAAASFAGSKAVES